MNLWWDPLNSTLIPSIRYGPMQYYYSGMIPEHRTSNNYWTLQDFVWIQNKLVQNVIVVITNKAYLVLFSIVCYESCKDNSMIKVISVHYNYVSTQYFICRNYFTKEISGDIGINIYENLCI